VKILDMLIHRRIRRESFRVLLPTQHDAFEPCWVSCGVHSRAYTRGLERERVEARWFGSLVVERLTDAWVMEESGSGRAEEEWDGRREFGLLAGLGFPGRRSNGAKGWIDI
jgi:hypothetical protein